jgi:hypothetical protein
MNTDGVKVDMVSENDLTEEQKNALFNQEASVDAIPDLDKLTGYVLEILEYLEQPKVKNILKTNETAIKMYLNNKYADTVPLGIIMLLMEEDRREENVDGLVRLFENLRRAKEGTISIDDAEKLLTDEVNEKYLYKEYGSKDSENGMNLSEIGKVNIKN